MPRGILEESVQVESVFEGPKSWWVRRATASWVHATKACKFHARLPPARQRSDRTVQVFPFEFEFSSDFPALPIGLTTVSHQKFERRFARQKRVVLPQIPDLESRMSNDLSRVEFIVAQNAFEQSRFACPIATDETHFGVAGDRAFSIFEKDLVAVTF